MARRKRGKNRERRRAEAEREIAMKAALAQEEAWRAAILRRSRCGQLSQRFFLPIHLLQPSEEINLKFLPLYGLATKEKQAGVQKKVARKKMKRTAKKVQEENEHV